MIIRKLPVDTLATNKAMTFLLTQKGREITASPSPFMLWLKPLVLAAEAGKLSFQYVIRKEMTNPIGTLHGGVTAGIIDDAIGATIYSLGEEHFYTTINNVIDYFAVAKENDIIIAETSIIKKGKQIINAQCEIWDKDKSRMLARGSSNLMRTKIKK